MDHLIDATQTLDLNPRQIYIILNDSNRKFRTTFESLAKSTGSEDIRYCIIDTTEFEERPPKESDLYRAFMEMDEEDGRPWDFIVRDYPRSKHDFSFHCEHIIEDKADSIREQLETLRASQEAAIVSSMTQVFRERLEMMSRTASKRQAFLKVLEDIQRAKRTTKESADLQFEELQKAFRRRDIVRNGQEQLVRAFVGGHGSIIDTYLNAKNSREASDELMMTFMETGGLISKPCVRIFKTTSPIKSSIHSRFQLEIRTSTGELFYPRFKMLFSFALYILYLKEAGTHFRKEDFLNEDGKNPELALNYCRKLATIAATLGENLYTHAGEALKEAEKACSEFLDGFQNDPKYWQNRNMHCDRVLKEAMGDKSLPFLVRPTGMGSKPERWIEISENFIDLDDPDFKDAYRKNWKTIVERELFVSALTDLSEQNKNPIFVSKTGKKNEEMKDFAEKDGRITCMGSGQYNFDRIMIREYPEGFELGRRNPFVDNVHTEEVGGTCGNVMCMLSYWGWRALPQAQFDMSREGYQMKKDLKRFGCDVSFVENLPEGGTAILDCIHRKNKDTGEHELGRKGYGSNGSQHPKRKQLRAKDEVPQLLARMQNAPNVYFFDTNEAGPRALADALRKRGSLIYYESEGFDKESEFHHCVEVADIIKFSVEHVKDLSICDKYTDKLFIQTLGGNGLQFRLKGGNWIHLDAEQVDNVVDWEGCGDTTTATFLYMLGTLGRLNMEKLEESSVITALQMAMKIAAKCTQYYGSKGWIHASKSFKPLSDEIGSPFDDPTVIAAFAQQNTDDHTKITSLDKIPAKDYREYPIKESFIYFSGGEINKGKEHKFKRGECSVLSNFYTCKLHFNGKDFTSAEQIYHFYRFRETPVIQEMIMQCSNGNQVKAACGGFTFRPKNHQVTRWRYMTLAMEIKYLQCKEFRQKLMSLGDTPLVESTPGFDFFGSTVPGDHKRLNGTFMGHDVSDRYIGMNGCGRCMMAVRDKFRGWTEAQLKNYTPSLDLESWWNSSPTYLEQLEGMGIE